MPDRPDRSRPSDDRRRAPRDVAACDRLSDEEKLVLLERVLVDELALQAADDDGMAIGRAPHACDVARLLIDLERRAGRRDDAA